MILNNQGNPRLYGILVAPNYLTPCSSLHPLQFNKPRIFLFIFK